MHIVSTPTMPSVECKAIPCAQCTERSCDHKVALPTKTTHVARQQKMQDAMTNKTQNRPKKLLASRTDDDPLVDISDRRVPNSRLAALYSGSRFKGIQKCGPTNYEVIVDILHVDIQECVLSGYLNIKGLTIDHPEITTFFQGEIIGPRFSFLTRKWGAERLIDKRHWERFPSFQPYVDHFNDDGFAYDPFDKDLVYMRWKEHFLVPDHRVNNIDGASYAGFYYICYQRSTNKITGFYYFRSNTEWYQELTLEHVEERSFGSFEYR